MHHFVSIVLRDRFFLAFCLRQGIHSNFERRICWYRFCGWISMTPRFEFAISPVILVCRVNFASSSPSLYGLPPFQSLLLAGQHSDARASIDKDLHRTFPSQTSFSSSSSSSSSPVSSRSSLSSSSSSSPPLSSPASSRAAGAAAAVYPPLSSSCVSCPPLTAIEASARARLQHVLLAYAALDPEVGYCQGENFCAAFLTSKLNLPEEVCFSLSLLSSESALLASVYFLQKAFPVFVCLLREYNMRSFFVNPMPGFSLACFQMTKLLQKLLPQLYDHFVCLAPFFFV